MPVLKITPDGKIITRGGLPSCTCCGCSPDYSTVYAELVDDPGGVRGGPFTTYPVLTGGLNAGSFENTESAYFIQLVWDTVAGEWYVSIAEFGFAFGTPAITDRCAPWGVYDYAGDEITGGFTVTISATALP